MVLPSSGVDVGINSAAGVDEGWGLSAVRSLGRAS